MWKAPSFWSRAILAAAALVFAVVLFPTSPPASLFLAGGGTLPVLGWTYAACSAKESSGWPHLLAILIGVALISLTASVVLALLTLAN